MENIKVFISHSGDEKQLAESFAQWLEEDLNGVKTFCTSRPGEIGAEEWRKRIFKEAKENDLLICLMSRESVNNNWIHFEAGLAMALETVKVVPVVYGGLKKNQVPSTLNHWQIIDLADAVEFERAFSKVFSDHINEKTELTLGAFVKFAGAKVGRFIQYGRFANLITEDIECEIIYGAPKSTLELVPGNAVKEFPITKNGKRISAIRLLVCPLPVEASSQWKFGLEIAKKGTSPGTKAFCFHSGCHFNITSFTVYPGNQKHVFVAVPALLSFNKTHCIELWFGRNFKDLYVVGVGSDSKYYRITRDSSDDPWRPDMQGCDIIRLYAWADGAPFRVSLEKVEFDYVDV